MSSSSVCPHCRSSADLSESLCPACGGALGPIADDQPASGEAREFGAELSDFGVRLEDDMHVTANGVIIKASTEAGVYHAISTIRQLLPPGFEKGTIQHAAAVEHLSSTVVSFVFATHARFVLS